jgi:effector-binding domain-containing protein
VAQEDIAPFLGTVFAEVLEVLGRQGLEPVGPPFGRYEVRGDGFEVEAGFPTHRPITAEGRVVPGELPGGTVATTVHTGGYDRVADAYAAVTSWLADHALAPSAPPWESYLDGPDVAVPRTDVCFPCRPASRPSAR